MASIPFNPALLHPEEIVENGKGRAKTHPYFDILCRVLFAQKPQVLVNFIEFMSSNVAALQAMNAISTKRSSVVLNNGQLIPNYRVYFYKRALNSLPMNSKLSMMQVECLANLYVAASYSEVAVKLLLSHQLPLIAIELVHKRSVKTALQDEDTDTQKYQNFLSLLEYAVICDVKILNQIWEFMPRSYSVFDLLTVLNTFLQTNNNKHNLPLMVTSSNTNTINNRKSNNNINNSGFTVDHLRPQLLKMYSIQMQGNDFSSFGDASLFFRQGSTSLTKSQQQINTHN